MSSVPAWPKVPWVNAHEQPEWFGKLQQAFVDAEICSWDARNGPHPLVYALVALDFFTKQVR